MNITIHPHALARIAERGTAPAEVIATVEEGERFPAKFGRTGFRRNFVYNEVWCGRFFATKQVEAFCADENGWLVITVLVKFF